MKGGERTEQVAVFVAAYLAEHGYSPTIDEIGEGVGLSSKSTVWHHLTRLRGTGRVTWLDGQPRTLRVVEIPPDGPGAPHAVPNDAPLSIPRDDAGGWGTPVRNGEGPGEVGLPGPWPNPLSEKES